MNSRRKGTDSPSLSPASTFSACRMRGGTRGLVTITCPSPASVGARIAAMMPGFPPVQAAEAHHRGSAQRERNRQQHADRRRTGSAG